MSRKIKINLYKGLGAGKDLLWQDRVYKKNDMAEYRKISRELERLLYMPKNNQKDRHAPGLRHALSSRQRCVLKMRIGKSAYTHQRFIKEYLSQENKAEVGVKPVLFSEHAADGPFIEEYNEAMTDKHFKLIISPESSRVDNEALTRTLVKRMEKITGYKFYWLAAVHTNTNHPHSHLLVNGKDRRGKDVRFNKVFITQTLREMSRQICTELIGKRSREEIRESILQCYKNNRFCSIDHEIQKAEAPLNPETDQYHSQVISRNDLMEKRLLHLSDIGLAKKDKNKRRRYLLEKEWAQKLMALGRYNSFLQARTELKSIVPCNLELYTKETGEIGGIVTRIYKMNDEDSWNHAVVVENAEMNKAWYVPLYYEPDSKLLDTEIRCKVKNNQKGLLVPEIDNVKRQEKNIRD
jgi:hypothetical protein